jgi:hypothetical protein
MNNGLLTYEGHGHEKTVERMYNFNALLPLFGKDAGSFSDKNGPKPNPLREWVNGTWRWIEEAKAEDPKRQDFDLPLAKSCSNEATSQAKLLTDSLFDECGDIEFDE